MVRASAGHGGRTSGELIGLVSMIVSLAAVAVAVWTTQRSRALSVSNSLQLVADVFRGALVAFDLVRTDIIIGPMCTQIIRTWHTLEASIAAERAHRASTYPAEARPGFLNYFEHLVAVVHSAGDRDASVRINRRVGVRRLTGPASGQ